MISEEMQKVAAYLKEQRKRAKRLQQEERAGLLAMYVCDIGELLWSGTDLANNEARRRWHNLSSPID